MPRPSPNQCSPFPTGHALLSELCEDLKQIRLLSEGDSIAVECILKIEVVSWCEI